MSKENVVTGGMLGRSIPTPFFAKPFTQWACEEGYASR
jgi:hypothetical protein